MHQLRHMKGTILQRTTVALPADLLGAVDQLIRDGSVATRNQFITLAIESELRRRERAAIDAEFARMGSDPEYQAEAARIMCDFKAADDESWSGLEER
jgi:metal-responsive CopG/Arc/MetJ family transcriptional regulator